MKNNIKFSEAPLLLFLSVIARSAATRQSHHSLMSFPLPFCHSYCPFVIPALSMSFPRKRESILCISFRILFHPSVIANTALSARQSHYSFTSFLLSICHSRESGNPYLLCFLFISHISSFFATKTIKKLYFLLILLYLLYKKDSYKTL